MDRIDKMNKDFQQILEARNKATHVYREEYAEELYEELHTYYEAFRELEKALV